MGIIPSTHVPAADEVIDAIAEIEMLRRETEKHGGLAMSCTAALQRLQELHDRGQEAMRLHGSQGVHASNVDAVTAEMERVRKLAMVTHQRPNARNPYAEQRGPSWRDAPRNPARNKGRRTMGRAGGR